VYSFAIIMWYARRSLRGKLSPARLRELTLHTSRARNRELLMREEPYEGVSLFEIINKVVTEKLRPRLPAPSAERPASLLDLIQR
jgi:hypothetical protein